MHFLTGVCAIVGGIFTGRKSFEPILGRVLVYRYTEGITIVLLSLQTFV